MPPKDVESDEMDNKTKKERRIMASAGCGAFVFQGESVQIAERFTRVSRNVSERDASQTAALCALCALLGDCARPGPLGLLASCPLETGCPL